MELEFTRTALEQKRTVGELSDYVLIASGGTAPERARAVLCSPGRDEHTTLFDAASMTKVLVTSTLILRAAGEGRLSLNDPLERYFDDVPADKRAVTVTRLLTHTSGIRRVNIPQQVADAGRERVARFVLSAPSAFAPGEGMLYSCNGFILLGFILEKIYGEPLDVLFERTVKPALGLTASRFGVSPDDPAAVNSRRRTTAGAYAVDDENAFVLRGVAGNAGSFWTAADVERYVQAVLRRDPVLYPAEYYGLAERDYTPDAENGRGLGWLYADSRYPQTGRLFSPGSFGHCGHTGTSVFIDRRTGTYVILLTNATRFTEAERSYEWVKRFRAEIHDRIADDMRLTPQ